jgi:2-keto-4-pentenoate hydratase/2-oxohepta-3-ene-1,7-dioic acid hydratase in catechol pathway
MSYKKLKFIDGSELETGTMYCIGQNYAKHAAEMGSKLPTDPVIFIKPPSALILNDEEILLPDISNNVHHEMELVVIIGDDCDSISAENAINVIAGYAIGVDVTLRDVQESSKKSGKPWSVSKGFKTSAPISYIIPQNKFKDKIPEFEMKLYVNSELRQHGFSRDMEKKIPDLIAYLSKIFTLRKGDVIFTGTPEGVGQIISGDKITSELCGEISITISAR